MEEVKISEKKEKQSFKVAINNLVWVIKEIAKISVFDLVGMFVVSLLVKLTPLLIAYFMSKVLDIVISATTNKIGSLNEFLVYNGNYKFVIGLMIAYALSTTLTELNRFFNRRYWLWDYRQFEMKVLRKLVNLDVQQYEDPKISNAIQKSKDALWKIFDSYGQLNDALADIFSIIAIGTVIFNINPLILLFILIMGIPQNIFNLLHTKRWWKWYENQVESSRKRYWLLSLMSSENIQEHKIFGSHNYLSDTTEKIYTTNNKSELKVQYNRIISNIFALIFQLPGYFLPMFYFIDSVLKGGITFGQFSFYTSSVVSFSDRMNWIISQLVEVYDLSTSISGMRYAYELEPIIKSGNKKLKLIESPEIEFRNVSFKYPGSKKYALQNINVVIKPNEEVAFVGENGAGKSTFVKLLLRFYDPTKGDILINGINLKDIIIEDYYRNISALFQEYVIYQPLDVKENIAMGKPYEKLDINNVLQSSKYADADKFINNLDNKYEQILSKSFTNGTNLSTGQWQKLALARFFYKNSKILILDEPTSSIDAVAEAKIFDRIYRLMKDKCVIIISHRFSTVRKAKKIYVFEKGKIVESGSHEELIGLNGKYVKAYNLQASGYKE